jgi:hypothetical protein
MPAAMVVHSLELMAVGAAAVPQQLVATDHRRRVELAELVHHLL